jgi:hypothetical protein
MSYILHGADIDDIIRAFINDLFDEIRHLHAANITNPLKIARILCAGQFAYRFPQALLLCQLVPSICAGRIARILIDLYDTLNQAPTDEITAMADDMFVLLQISADTDQ